MDPLDFDSLREPLKASKRWKDTILDKYKIDRSEFENKVSEILES